MPAPEEDAAPPPRPAVLAGCGFCDAVNRVPTAAGAAPDCWRCGSPLESADAHLRQPSPGPTGAAWLTRSAAAPLAAPPHTVVTVGDRPLVASTALLTAAAIALLAANLLPMVALDLQGQHSAVTLANASATLWGQGHEALAATLFLTTVLAPVLETGALLAAALAVTVGVRPRPAGSPPRWLNNTLHLAQGMRAWNLTEVLVLGTGVALVKLGQLATLTVGAGLVSLMAFMALRLLALRLWSAPRAWARLWQTAR